MPCACGCGTPLPALNSQGQPSRYVRGHNPPTPPEQRAKRKFNKRSNLPVDVPCACGCGTLLPRYNKRGRPSRYVKGHSSRGRQHSAVSRDRSRQTIKRKYDFVGRKEPTWARHNDARYKEWRLAVLERDQWTCQQCGHRASPREKGFAAHHILPYATHPEARFEVANGQALCRMCHMRLHGISLKPRSMKTCRCGCGTLIPSHTPEGRERFYVNGHGKRNHRATGEQRQRMSDAHKGYRPSQETRAKLSALRKGKPVPAQMTAASVQARRKLSMEDAALVRSRVAAGEAQNTLAREYGVTPNVINKIVKGHTYRQAY